MFPYKNKKLTDWPDISDVKDEGRKTSAGGKDYFKNKKAKASSRRYLKRADKQKSMSEIKDAI